MFTVADFKLKYAAASDEDLYDIQANPESYSAEAVEAAKVVIEDRGGLTAIENKLAARHQVRAEANRIRHEVEGLFKPAIDDAFLMKMITSEILTPEQVHEVVNRKLVQLRAEHTDTTIKPRTVYGSLLGLVVASLVGGILIILLLDQKRIPLFLLMGIFALNYGIIKLMTRQSHKNVIVLIASVFSVALSYLVAMIIASVIGR